MEFMYQTKVGEVVAEDFRSAAVFAKYGIDFCCKGNISIEEACEKNNIMTEDVMRELKIMLSKGDPELTDYKSWSAPSLADYIEGKHHQYVVAKTPVILSYLAKLCEKHGERHPELHTIHRLFSESARELAQHMKKEEVILFPWIRKIASTSPDSPQEVVIPSIEVQNPIQQMMYEHDAEGERFRTIDTLTNHYQPPADACATYKVTYAMLQEFEKDLHIHIHLENNILFPMAIEMEKSLKH